MSPHTPPSFTVLECLRTYAWGAKCRLRLDTDVRRDDVRWGYDWMGGPKIEDRSVHRPAGWEVEATLTIPGLKPGDKVPLDTVIGNLPSSALGRSSD